MAGTGTRARSDRRAPHARARPEAERRRAAEAREEPARDARRASRADRHRLRGRPRGGHRPPQVVGPLPRQAEGRHLHAPHQARRGPADAGAAARDRASSRSTHGRGEAELTTRQNVQLHYLRLAELPDVFEKLHAAGLTSLGGCGDAVRAITGCPVAGIAHDELFDATPVVEEAHAFFTGIRTTSTCPASTRSRSARAPTAATRRRSTASRSSASSATASRASACSSAAASRPCPGSRATSASSSGRTRRSPCCARCSTRGGRTCATASRASRRA